MLLKALHQLLFDRNKVDLILFELAKTDKYEIEKSKNSISMTTCQMKYTFVLFLSAVVQ